MAFGVLLGLFVRNTGVRRSLGMDAHLPVGRFQKYEEMFRIARQECGFAAVKSSRGSALHRSIYIYEVHIYIYM